MPNEELQAVLPNLTQWKYQIVRYDDGMFGLHEVYLDDQGEVFLTTHEPVAFVGRTPGELINDIRDALKDALEPRPTVDMEGENVEGIQQGAVDAG